MLKAYRNFPVCNKKMLREEETTKTWNKIYELYQEKFMDLDLYNQTYDFICNSIKDKANILEIGCGPGNITKYLLSKRPDFNIYGIDIASNMIKLAQKNNPTANFDVMNSRKISEIKTKFDGIVCGFCLPYLSELESSKLIFDSYNLLNNDGLIYISFVEGDQSKSGFQTNRDGDRVYFYYHNCEQLKSQFIESNFKEIEIFNLKYKKSETEIDIHTIITAKKK